MKNAIAIFGYNNSRIYDVEKIKALAKAEYGAEIILIKEGIDHSDRALTPFCVDEKPESPRLAVVLQKFCADKQLNLLACVPFSDKGVVGAAYAAQSLGLFHDDVSTASAMLDKFAFRTLEASLQTSSLYKKPKFQRVFTADSMCEFFELTGPFFAKPALEGNSRGCMQIRSREDLDVWLSQFGQYLKHGVICEEYLQTGNEFSFDGVNGMFWITQKFTTTGSFRAEYQQIVPAPLSEEISSQVYSVLTPLMAQLGSYGGAFHHEFFIQEDSKVASVEPNRRPAGMWIWDLASWSFENYSPWQTWLRVLTQNSSEYSLKSQPLQHQCYSGIRAVRARKTGHISTMDISQTEAKLKKLFGDENIRFSFLKKIGEQILEEPRDNSDFIAYVALKNKNYEQLLLDLQAAEDLIAQSIEVAP